MSGSRLIDSIAETAASTAWAGEAAYDAIRDLYPICRSITGDGLRATLRKVAERIPLTLTEVPSGTQVFDWTVPKEWNIHDAYVRDSRGEKVVDFKTNNLHVVNYSVPVRLSLPLEELREHLFISKQHPDWIPYRTSYYREGWGFCLTKKQYDSLAPGQYEVVVDSTLEDGSLTYGECVLPGASDREFLIFTHCCHPSTCNDNLTGIAVAALLARYIADRERRYTYRFIFAPATIGSIVWLARNEKAVGAVEHGLVVGLLGDAAPLTYKKSRRSSFDIDRIAQYVLAGGDFAGTRIRDFSPYGYDERQFCSPGFDLPVGRLTRSSNGEYAEYHSSADNLDFISPSALAESFLACLRIIAVAESCRKYRNRAPKCEPRLGKYGLYGAIGGTGPGEFEHALLWVLNQSDGSRDLLDIAGRAGIHYSLVAQAAEALVKAGLLEVSE